MTETSRERLPLFNGDVNPSVLPEDELRLSKHCRMMFSRLKFGPATNVQLRELCNSFNPTARRTDLRQELQRAGWDLKLIKRLGNGLNLYGIITPDGRVWNE